ncbi:MAG: hypothetical protein QF371_07605, partial [Flavobacteriales bacterium]|nr:hypothetical protein [Flavobacteriales bacterium]
IFISHLHGDHYLGLMGMLWSMELLGRKKSISIAAPKGLEELIQLHLKLASASLGFELEIRSLEDAADIPVYKDKNMTVHAFGQNHRIPCFGFSFTEPPKPRNLIKDKIENLGLPVNKIRALKAGQDVKTDKGRLIKAIDVSSEPKLSKRYVFCTDTLPQKLPESAENADLLYHEATYDHSLADKAEARFHSTSIQAAEVALESTAKKLIIGHFSSRYRDNEPMLSEAQRIFPSTISAKDGLTIPI